MQWESRDAGGGKGDPFEKFLGELQRMWNQLPVFKGWKTIIGVVVIILLLWSSIYIVAPDEQGVILRFGDVVRTSAPGPHLKIPLIETVLLPKVTKLHRLEVGFRTGRDGVARTIPREALMLTGDENILAVELIVQFRIKDARNFLFNVDDVGPTIKKATEASIRQVIGQRLIDEALTVGKAEIQLETQDLLQQILDDYQAGVQITAVQLQDVNPPGAVEAAFKDVASAKEDKEKLINEAHGYRNDIIPKAKGEAAQIVNEAMGYAQARIDRAQGEGDRFRKTLKEYSLAKDIIRKRVYIETMEEILPNMQKVIIDKKIGGQILPYLPLGGGGFGGKTSEGGAR